MPYFLFGDSLKERYSIKYKLEYRFKHHRVTQVNKQIFMHFNTQIYKK